MEDSFQYRWYRYDGSRMHATSLQRNPHAEVVAVCAHREQSQGIPGGVRRTHGYTNVDELKQS